MADAPRILIVTSRYYAHITAELEAGVVEGLDKVGATHEFLEVPGAFEIPGAIAMAAQTGEWDGFVALGCVIRGETSHYDLICEQVAHGLMELSISGVPLGFGVLTVEVVPDGLGVVRVILDALHECADAWLDAGGHGSTGGEGDAL